MSPQEFTEFLETAFIRLADFSTNGSIHFISDNLSNLNSESGGWEAWLRAHLDNERAIMRENRCRRARRNFASGRGGS
jgi:hypothetical protein